MSTAIVSDRELKSRILELLEDIEAATSEIHERTLLGRTGIDHLAREASDLAAEGERLVARRIDEAPAVVHEGLLARRDRLRGILRETSGIPSRV